MLIDTLIWLVNFSRTPKTIFSRASIIIIPLPFLLLFFLFSQLCNPIFGSFLFILGLISMYPFSLFFDFVPDFALFFDSVSTFVGYIFLLFS